VRREGAVKKERRDEEEEERAGGEKRVLRLVADALCVPRNSIPSRLHA